MNHSEKNMTYFLHVICYILYSYIFTHCILVRIIDAADPESNRPQKKLLIIRLDEFLFL